MSVDQVVIELLIECSLLPLVHIMPSFLFIVTTSLQAFSKKILVFWTPGHVSSIVSYTTFTLHLHYVPVKLKLKHDSPQACPRHLTSFPAREGGNLMNLVFPGMGHLITTHRG